MRAWCYLAKATVRSPSVVVVDEFSKQPLQMLVAQNEPTIQTLVTDGAYPTFCDRVSLGSFYRSTDLTDMHRSDSLIKRSAKATVMVVNQVAGRLSRNLTGFNHLLCQPRFLKDAIVSSFRQKRVWQNCGSYSFGNPDRIC